MARNNIKNEVENVRKEFYQGMRQLREEQRNTNKMVGQLTDSWGKFVEGLVAPSIPQLFKKLGIRMPTIYQRAKAERNGDYLEIDVLAEGMRKDGRDILILTEVKSNLRIQDVDDALENFRTFFKYFRKYKGMEFIAAVAAIRLESDVQKYAQRHGLYVLSPSGNTMKILNPKGFKPKVWR